MTTHCVRCGNHPRPAPDVAQGMVIHHALCTGCLVDLITLRATERKAS